jgi:radical SAM protein with 4Fe4S-binding SPASM domain
VQAISIPVYYSLELTAVCNSLCPVCSNVFLRHKDVLGAAQWRQVLGKIAPHAQVFKLTGGEATLHPEFPVIIEAVAETGVPFALFSNGRWRDATAVIHLLQSIPTFTGLLISLHGPDAAAHEGFTHTPHSFAETCENIHRATAAGLRVHTSTVITRYNWQRSAEIVSLSQQLGAKRAVFNRYLGPPMPDIEPGDEHLRWAVQDIEQLIRQHPYTADFSVRYGNCIPQCFTPSSSSGCWAGIAYCTIDPWGGVRPCNHSPTLVGNLFEQSLQDLWHSETMDDWRNLMPSPCKGCSEFGVCHGGCRALIEIRQKDPLVRIPLSAYTSCSETITLYEKSRPILNCSVQSEVFGFSLIHGHQLVQVTKVAEPLLASLAGTTTLEEVKSSFGQEGLDFVGTLYAKGLLILK